MRQLLGLIIFSVVSVGVWGEVPEAKAQTDRIGLISNVALKRYGLTRQWHTHVEVDRSHGRLRYITPHISQTEGVTVFEVTDGQRTWRFSERDRDRFGDRIGKLEAEALADEKMSSLKRNGVEQPDKTAKVVPKITLYCATDHGVVHAVDGENGETLWVRTIGSRDHPTLAPGVSEKYLAVVNGSVLYVVDRNSGKDIWSRKLDGTPGAGPAVADYLIHVPMVSGMMESYEIKNPRTGRMYFKSHGIASMQPILTQRVSIDPDLGAFTASSVVWATDRGQVYVNHANKKGTARFRLEANDTITDSPTFLPPNNILVGSLDGYVYCVNEFSGEIRWRFSTGQPISRSVVPIEEHAYLTTDDGGMFKIDTQTELDSEREIWWSPQVKRFIAASDNRVYALTETGRMNIIDSQSGARLGTLSTEALDFAMVNKVSDRIYIGTRAGVIQCIRETENLYPILHNAIKEEDRPQIQQNDVDKGEVAGGDPQVDPGVGKDPFGGGPAGGDPFGGAGGDPFGGAGGDPFGGAGGDPFGGAGGDPFGAGGGTPMPTPQPQPPAGGGGGDPFGGGAGGDPFGAGAGGDPFGAGAGGAGADPFGAGDPFK